MNKNFISKLEKSFLVFFSCIVFSHDAFSQTSPILGTKGKYFFIDFEPFFPIGVYDFPEKREDDAIWKEAAEAGINFKLSKQSGKYGILVSKPIPKTQLNEANRSLMEVQYGKEVRSQLKDFLNKHETDNTIICWHAPDEPSWFGPAGHSLMNGYDFIKQNSKKPIWLNESPSFTDLVHFGTAESYLSSCDVISEDIYPIPENMPKKGQGHNQNMFLVGEHTKKIVDFSTINNVQQKPVWMVLQGFGWSSLNKIFKNPDTYIPPTKHELRFMVYDAIVNGATGIIFWGLEFESEKTESGKAIWQNIKEMTTELKGQYPILTSLTEITPNHLIVSTTDTTNNPIKYLLKTVGKDTYIIVVNSKKESQKNIQFKVTEQFKGSVSNVTEIFSKKTYPLKEDRIWTDDIEGYGVRVFKTNMNFVFLKHLN
jgi:hypothetical protein